MSSTSTLAARPSLVGAADIGTASRWKIAGLVLRIALSAGLFGVTLWLAAGNVDWRQMTALGPGTIALCLALSAATVLLLAWRWRAVASGLSGESEELPAFSSFARLIWIGLAVNQVAPTMLGGDALRVALLARQGMAAARSAASVIIDRLYGFLGLAVLCLLGIPIFHSGFSGLPLLAAALAGAAVLAIPLLIILAGRYWSWAGSLTTGMRRLLDWRTGVTLILAAVAGHITNIAIFLVIAHALNIDLPLLPAIAVMAFVLLGTALPISIAGWGLRELTLLQAFSYMGAGTDTLLLASVLYGLFLLFTQALGFLLLVGRNRP